MTAKQILILKKQPPQAGEQLDPGRSDRGRGKRAAVSVVESFDLHVLPIRPSYVCDFCQGAAECVINDDMQMLYPKLRRSRWDRCRQPDLLVHPQCAGEAVHRPLVRAGRSRRQRGGGQAVRGLVLIYGDIDPYTSGAINVIRTFQDMCRYIKADLAGIVYGAASDPGEITQPAEGAGARLPVGAAVGPCSRKSRKRLPVTENNDCHCEGDSPKQSHPQVRDCFGVAGAEGRCDPSQ